MRRTAVIALLVAATGGATSVACTCVARSDAEHLAAAEVVFAGTTLASTDANPGPVRGSGDPITWTFAVDRVAKGAVGSTIEIVTARSSSNCGATFTIGQRYVVYAHEDRGHLSTSICSGTRAVGVGEPPFRLRYVAVYLTSGDRLAHAVGKIRPGEHPGRGAVRLLGSLGHPRGRAGPSSAVPPGTRLLRYAAGGGTVRVVLSRQFAAIPAARRRLALAQVVYTATDLPGAVRVRVRTPAGPIPGYDRALRRADFRREAGAGLSGR